MSGRRKRRRERQPAEREKDHDRKRLSDSGGSRLSGGFVRRRPEIENRKPCLPDEAGKIVDAGTGTICSTEDEQRLRAEVDSGKDRTPVLFESAATMGETVAIENQSESEVETAAVVGRPGGDEDRLPPGIGKKGQFTFGENATDVGATTADNTEGIAGLHDSSAPTDIVGERSTEYVGRSRVVGDDHALWLTASALPLDECDDASCVRVQTIASPAFKLGGVVAQKEDWTESLRCKLSACKHAANIRRGRPTGCRNSRIEDDRVCGGM